MSGPETARAAEWVVGVDGSAGSIHALRWALSQASERSVNVTAVRCWQPVDGTLDDPNPDQQLRAAKLALHELRAMVVPQSSDLEVEVARGHAADVLLERAETVDLLVLGTRGLGGLQRLLLGSVSLYCATNSTTPVAIVPPSAKLDGSLAGMVVGVDDSDQSRDGLRWAVRFARPETAVQVVGVWEPASYAGAVEALHFNDLFATARAEFDATVDKALYSSTAHVPSITRSFHYAKAATMLLEHGADADLMVLGARGRGGLAAAILGSVTNAVLHQARCPVVVVPKDDGS